MSVSLGNRQLEELQKISRRQSESGGEFIF
jgi:hypothetical protein